MTRRELMAVGVGALGVAAAAREATAASLVERLGYGKEERLLMIHADDAGMCRSVNLATQRAMSEGVCSSASVMVPCPWFPQMAEWAVQNPKADLGAHLTLTSEWRLYRWGPTAPSTKVPSLLDEQGFLWRNVEGVRKNGKPEEVEIEIRAQIERARKFGMKLTHVDSHMGALFSAPKFFDVYIRVAKEMDVVPMVPGPTPLILIQAAALGLDYKQVTEDLARKGYPVLDLLSTGLHGNTYEDRKKSLFEFVKALKPGFTKLIVHLSGDEDEIRNIAGSWPTRFNEFKMMLDPEVREFLKAEKVKLVGYRDLLPLWGKPLT